MVKIRLRRVGAKKQPSYRVVVADSRAKRDGRFIENIGHYNPRTDPPTVVIKEDRALYWLSVGAQPTEAVAGFFSKLNLADKVKQVHGGASIADLAPAPAKAKAAKAAPAEAPVKPAKKAAPAQAPAPVVADEPAVVEAPVVAEAAEPMAEPVVETTAPMGMAASSDAMEEPAQEPATDEATADEPVVDEPVAGEATADDAAADDTTADDAMATGDLAGLGLSARVAKALEQAGVADMAALRELHGQGRQAILDLPGIGEKAADEIIAQLESGEGGNV